MKRCKEGEDEHDNTIAKLLFDILIMAHANGKERNKKEWENLFFEAGFSHYKLNSVIIWHKVPY